MLNDVLTAPIPEEADSLHDQAAQQFPRAQCDAGMSDTATQWPGEAFGPVIMGHVSVRQHETDSDIKLEKDCMMAVITNLWNYH